jgi:multidrug efflux system membrane fusion protein
MSPSSAPNEPDSSSFPPAVANPRRWTGRRIALGGLAFVVLAGLGGGGYYYWDSRVSADLAANGARGGKDRLTPIVVEPVVIEDFPVRLSAIGTVVPRTMVTVRSRVDGTLNKLHFEEGQTVRAGQLLAEIDPRPFEVALSQMQGQMARDQALLTNAQADLARYESLAKLDAIPLQQLDTQRALVRQYEAAVKMDLGQVDNARLQLSYTRITAPSEGRVGLRQVDPGNLVRSSDANGLVLITQVQPVTVVFPIAEADLGKLLQRLGMRTPPAGRGDNRRAERSDPPVPASGSAVDGVAVEAWDREGKVLLATGKLLSVDNQIDVTTGTVKVKAIFANRDGALFPNQFVNVRLIVNELKDATVIASAAVQRGSRGSFVWLLKEDKTISMRPVTVGVADGNRIPVLEGLQAGEQVAVDGFDRLREGGKVEVVTRDSRAVKSGPGKRGPRSAAGPGAGQVAANPAATPAAVAGAGGAPSGPPTAPASQGAAGPRP